MLLLLLAVAFVGQARPAGMQPGDFQTFRCQFQTSASAQLKDGAFASEPKIGPDSFATDIVFDKVDLKAGTARLIGNAGASDLDVTGHSKAIHFIEETYSGNLILTSIFGPAIPGTLSDFRIVMSRHIYTDLIGTNLSQMYGVCKAVL